MAARTIRCGRCHYEFIIGGVDETTCPQCGARNRIPGMTAATEGPVVDTTAPEEEGSEPAASAGARWVVCPSCAYRFAVGEVESVNCPLCATEVAVS